MITVLEIIFISLLIPYVTWPIFSRQGRPDWVYWLPVASFVAMGVHWFFDNEPFWIRFYPFYIFIILVNIRNAIRILRKKKHQINSRRAFTKGLAAILAIFLFFMIPLKLFPVFPTPAPDGPYNIGTISFGWTDEAKEEFYTQDPGDKRKIAVQFWYPADHKGKGGLELDNAQVSKIQEKYPLLIFSHGALGFRKSNLSTMQLLASHGYIVCSIDHSYHAFFTSFPDGSNSIASQQFLEEISKQSSGTLTAQQDLEIIQKWLDIRVKDVELVLKQIKVISSRETACVLSGHIDESRMGIFGHSLGGAAAAAIARNYPQFKAVGVIDGTMIGEIERVQNNERIIRKDLFNTPLLLMYNSLQYDIPEIRNTGYKPNLQVFESTQQPVYSIIVKSSGHLNYTDLPLISPVIASMLGTGTVDADECIRIMNGYILSFFNSFLQDEPTGLPSHSFENEKVVVKVRNK